MKDNFQWTPELWCEFLNGLPVMPPSFAANAEQFKSSKAPKKEWEIVAYSFEPLKGIDKPVLVTQGSKYWESAISGDKDFLIHSVRRLSDGEVFSVGDRFTCSVYSIPKRINGFIIADCGWLQIKMDDGDMLSHVYGNPLEGLKKLAAPVLATVDGVEVFKGEDYWGAEVGIGPCCYKAGDESFIPCANMKLFSTKEAALQYQFENRPVLSLNDVKKVYDRLFPDDHLVDELTALVKQKLNQ